MNNSQGSSNALLPCPHCHATHHGGVVHVSSIWEDHEDCCEVQLSHGESWCVVCDAKVGGCGAASGYDLTEEKAIAKWNRRYSSSEPLNAQAIRAAIEQSAPPFSRADKTRDASAQWIGWDRARCAVEAALRAGPPQAVIPDQDVEKLAWAQTAYEDGKKYLDDGGGQSIHVRQNRALGILFAEIERLEKMVYLRPAQPPRADRPAFCKAPPSMPLPEPNTCDYPDCGCNPPEAWRPIETHDGSGDEVLGASNTEDWVCAMERHSDVWRCTNNPPTDSWGRDIYPTHWMPLPPGPTKEV